MGQVHQTKAPEVSGLFYTDDPEELSQTVADYIRKGAIAPPFKKIRGLIAPHAGHIYSGAIAGSAYSLLAKLSPSIKTIVLLGPSHQYPLEDIAIHSADFFSTPLGKIPVDQTLKKAVLDFPFVRQLDAAFIREHSLEVHLPFIQRAAPQAAILPLLVGYTPTEKIAELIALAMASDTTFLLVSSDLSHFHPYLEARKIDGETTQMIEDLHFQTISGERACGCYPIKGLLQWAKNNNYQLKAIDVRNSGDTAGDKTRVVGYGAYVLGLPE